MVEELVRGLHSSHFFIIFCPIILSFSRSIERQNEGSQNDEDMSRGLIACVARSGGGLKNTPPFHEILFPLHLSIESFHERTASTHA